MRFPKRTVVLMILAIFAFGWMYWQTHRAAPQSAGEPVRAHPVELLP